MKEIIAIFKFFILNSIRPINQKTIKLSFINKNMKKRPLKMFGIFLIVLGLIFTINSFQITGFEIFEEISQTAGSFIGIILIAGGLIIFATATKFATPSFIRSLEDIIEDLGEDTSIIIDSGPLIDLQNTNQLDSFVQRLKGADKNDVYVPQEVLRELKKRKETGQDIERLRIESWSPHEKGVEKYKNIAQTYLDLTSKAQTYFKLFPFYQDVQKAVLRSPEINHDEIISRVKKEYSEKVKDIDTEIGKLERRYEKQLRGLSIIEKYNFIRTQLDNHFKPSAGDRDVLAYAMYRARMGNQKIRREANTKLDREYSRVVSIFSNDSDIREAIDLIKKGYHGESPRPNRDGTHDRLDLKPSRKMWRYLSYINPKGV